MKATRDTCLGTESEGEATIWDMPAQGQEERGVAKPTMLLESLLRVELQPTCDMSE